MIKLIKVKFSRPALLLIFFALFCCLVACGGSKDESTSTGGGGTTTAVASLVLSVPPSITFSSPVTITAVLKDASGNLMSGSIVSFAASDTSLVTFTPPAATSLTGDGSGGTILGTASIKLNAASSFSAGATYISASADITSGGTTTKVTSVPVGISVGAAEVTLGEITLTPSSINAYGSSNVSVPVLIGGSSATVPISVSFTSSCVISGRATIASPRTNNTSTGIAATTYTDNGCSGTDTIVASITSGPTKSALITVSTPATTNIEFVSATPSTIGTSTASSSSLQTSSVVKFKVVDSSNKGVAGVLVDFSVVPDSKPGGLYLSPATATGTTDADGYVSISLIAGTVPTPVWVVATVDGTTLKSQSNSLSITTGLPTQNFFSLSVSTFNIEGLEWDTITSTLTIIASDRLGNPIPDGTAINFISEGAQIKSPCTIAGGTCSTTFTSSADKPANGRVSILAYALGEKSFIDTIGANNSYDLTPAPGETFYDIGDPYVDSNENGLWDPGETYIPSKILGSSPCIVHPVTIPSTPFPHSYANALSRESSCTGLWGQNYVRRNVVLVLSGSKAYLSPTSFIQGHNCTNYFHLTLRDENVNPMPAGTTITTANNNIFFKSVVAGPTGPVITQGTAEVQIIGSPVANTNLPGGTGIDLTVSGGATCTTADSILMYPVGTVDLVVTAPKGRQTTFRIYVSES